MANLKVFESTFVEKLREVKSLDFYTDPNSEFDLSSYPNAVLVSQNTELPDAVPVLSSKIEDDAQSAEKIFNYLKISPIQASDSRLWAYLTHVTFCKYVKSRWPIDQKDEEKNKIKKVRTQWLATSSSRSFRTNAIARLWWAAYSTVAPWENDVYFKSLPDQSDRFIYTKVMFSKQDIATNLLDRRFGRSQHIIIAILEFIRTHKELETRNLYRSFFKEINLMLSYCKLMNLSLEQLQNKFEEVYSNLTPNDEDEAEA
ncbi:MAG: hypothetical protein IKA08_02795 [Alphaproteobacteria bacterium]|nr:hypothetical protein [Alphaproteobacteria bacterium]